MRQMMYLIGQPGSGKTTLMRSVFKGVQPIEVLVPFSYVLYPNGIELGGLRPGFGGTDTLALSCQPTVIGWLQTVPFTYVTGEGDRLANDKFFSAVTAQGWELSVVHLDCPDDIAAGRRAARGSNQNAAWVKGRATKVRRLAETWATDWVLDARLSPEVLTKRLRAHPVVQGILLDNNSRVV